MPVRQTLLFAVTTTAKDPTQAAPHSGGWSESFYVGGNAFNDVSIFKKWATQRALLLSGLASVIGYRQQLYTLSGNKLLPGGSGGGVFFFPGNYAGDLNAPQDSLQLNFVVTSQPNSIRHRIAAVPDTIISGGEYNGDTTYQGYLSQYFNVVVSLGFGAVTRDLTKPDATVRSITGGVITTNTSTGAALNQYIRLRRVKDNLGHPVEGTFLVAAIVNNADGSVAYTVINPPTQTVSNPNGTARLDVLVFNSFSSGSVGRLVVRKVGRPFAAYRGRRSKRT